MIAFESFQLPGEPEWFVCELEEQVYPRLVDLDGEQEHGYEPRITYYVRGELRAWLNEHCEDWAEESIYNGVELYLCSHSHVMAFILRWS